MKSILRARYLGLLMAIFCSQLVQAAPYGPQGRITSFTQPSGKKIQLRVHGDEYYGRTETAQGHTVVYDSVKNAYFYAQLSEDGSQFVSTEIPADQEPPAGIDKHIEISGKSIQAIRASRRTQADLDRANRWKERVQAKHALRAAGNGARLSQDDLAQASVKAAPLVGNIVGLTLLVEFQDVKFPTNVAKMERVLNQDNYVEDGNSGSVKDYFFDQSNGQLTYTQLVPAKITLSGRRADYNKGDAGTAGRKLLLEALDILVNRGGFDPSTLTANGANNVLATNVFFAGPDSGVWAQGLWPHQWTLASPFNIGGGKFSFAYQMTNLENDKPVIGTFCHESGHLITDYPDLYDYGGESEGVGQHCLMGSGNHLNDEKTPAPINLYFKDLVGWANFTDVSPTTSRPAWLPSTGNEGIRIINPDNPVEFFVVENRGDGDKWADFAVDKGILIWHVDDSVLGNDYQERTPSLHYQVSVEQADGRYNLENGINRGDNLDLYDLIRSQFNSTTIPDSRWWSGAESGVDITVRSLPGTVMRVDFGNVQTDTITVINPNGGEVWFQNDTRMIDWVAGIEDTIEIDLMQGNTVVMNIATGETNDGQFEWTIPNTVTPATNYTIRVSGSLKSNISDTSDATFQIKSSRSLADAVDLTDREWTSTGDSLWFPQTTVSFDEEDAAQVGPLADNQNGTIRSQFEGPSEVSFRWRTSSLFGSDFLSVEVEGSPQIAVPAPISGTGGWQEATVELPEGTHTLAWTFSRGAALDFTSTQTAWLDQVKITPRYPDIEITDTFGSLLESQASTVGLGITTVQGEPVSQVLTIWNKGDARMKGITLGIANANKPGFSVNPSVLPDMEPGESARITVTLQPQLSGTNSASLSVASNDPDENPYLVNLIADVTGPELVVLNGTSIMPNGKITDFGQAIIGKPVTRSFQIRNSGEAALKNINVTITSSAGGTWTAAPINGIIYPGHSNDLVVTFLASKPGIHSGTISITSNDWENTPFLIPVTANAITAPGLSLQEITATTSLDIADSLNFGAHPLGEAPKQVKMRISNIGSNSLSNIKLAKSGDYSGEFSIIGSVPTQLAPGAKVDVMVAFSPKAAGYRFCDIAVTSNDPTTPRKTVKLFGDARLMPTPALSLKSATGRKIPLDNPVIRFGKIPVKGMDSTRRISLENLGLIRVSDIRLVIKGTSAADYSIQASPSDTLDVGAESKFQIQFDPSEKGVRSATLYILSNDPAQPRIKIELTGEGVPNKGPDIAVQVGKKSLESGTSVIRMNGTGKNIIRAQVINKGDSPLKHIRLATAGASAKHFKVSKSKMKSLAPGESAEFEIRFTPGKDASVKSTLKIRSNDKNENPFTITLLGSD